MSESVFPLNIADKEDHPDKIALLEGLLGKYFESAAEVNKKTRALEELFLKYQSLTGGFQNSISSSETPANNGLYAPEDEATYANFGDLVYSPSTTDKGFLVFFIKKDAEYSKIRIDLNVIPATVISENNTDLVPSGLLWTLKQAIDEALGEKFNTADVAGLGSTNIDDENQSLFPQMSVVKAEQTARLVGISPPTNTNFIYDNNIINETIATHEGYSLASGVLTENTGFNSSDFKRVKPSTLYSNNNSNHVNYHDINYNYISGVNAVSSFTTPSNCAYIRVDNAVSGIAFSSVTVTEGSVLGEIGVDTYKFKKPIVIDQDALIASNSAKALEIEKSITSLENSLEDVEVLRIEDYTTIVTAVFEIQDFSKYRGNKITVKVKGAYTGRFGVYSYAGAVSTLLADVDSTDFSTEQTLIVTIPLDCENIAFRTWEIGTPITYIKLYSSQYKESYLPLLSKPWRDKTISFYGDSITAISNGTFSKPFNSTDTWSEIIGANLDLNSVIGRGVGSQKYDFDRNYTAVVFLNSDGSYNSRDNSYTYDNYEGNVTVPSGTTTVRGAFSSWLRIKEMYPTSIKDTIDSVVIMGGTNDAVDATPLAWVENDTTDPEWATSTEYATYGGDYNIDSLEGGIASTIMKFQAWMPNTRLIIATPLSGRGVTGELNPSEPLTQEYTKSLTIIKVANIFSIPVININFNTGINGLNRTTYITDGVHPYGLEGQKSLAMGMIGGLVGIYPNLK